MTGLVSVPEKTLEHWSSQYIAYRYRSWAAQWWPVSGEDIDVRWLPGRPGKVVQLELKTTKVIGPGVHEVNVDLGQLWDYCHRPLGLQPFYAFPRPGPDWQGDLTDAASRHGRVVTELAYARSGGGWWFADWMMVLTTAQVAEILRADLASHGSGKRKNRRSLVRFDQSRSAPLWGSGATAPEAIGWRDFWTELERCGRLGWPQLIRLPSRLIQRGTPYPPPVIPALLRAAAVESPDVAKTGDDEEPLVTLAPEPDGTYLELSAPADRLSLADEAEADRQDMNDQADDHRQVIFLDSRALLKDS
jgi:hypothetical protein